MADDAYQAYLALCQSCIDEGLLTKAFGRNNLRITKKGQELVKVHAANDPEVADAVRECLATPLLERREAFVSLVHFVRMRHPRNESD